MNKTGIQWTDITWNPVTGCDPISPGCDHCYAEVMARRFAGRKGWGPKDDPFGVTYRIQRLAVKFPKKPKRIFVCSMADLFHPKVPSQFIRQVFKVIHENPAHTFQILTKRPEKMARECAKWMPGSFLPNLWLGVTAENQAMANKRIPILREIPAALRFVSCEPLIGPIEFDYYLDWIDWVIIGGETGKGAREMSEDWAFEIIGKCVMVETPVFLKQWGSASPLAGHLAIRDELKRFPTTIQRIQNGQR